MSAWRASPSIHLRHAELVRGHPARRHERVDDDERRRASSARALHRCRRGTGREAGAALGHDPKRHPQRIHGAQHLYLPARSLDADHLGYFRLHYGQYAEVQLDLDFRLSHAGGRRFGRSRARLYARRRPRLCARRDRGGARYRRFRATPLLLFRHRHEFLHGGRETSRRAPAVDRADGRFEPKSENPCAAGPLPDLGMVAHRAGHLQQRLAHHDRGHGGDAGRHAIASHQRTRRGARPADGFLGPHRAQHPDPVAAGERHDARHRSLGRQFLHRASHRRSPRQGAGPYGRGRATRRDGEGDREGPAQDAHRGGRGEDAGAHRRGRSRHRRQQLQAAGRGADRHPQGRQLGRARRCSSTSSRASSASATRAPSRRRSRR